MANQPTGLLALNQDLLLIKRDLEVLIDRNLDMHSKGYQAEWAKIVQRINIIQDRLKKFIKSLDPIANSKQLEAYPIARVDYIQGKLKDVKDNILLIDFGKSGQPAILVEAAKAIKDAHDRWQETLVYFAENMEKLAPGVQSIVKSVIQSIQEMKETRRRVA